MFEFLKHINSDPAIDLPADITSVLSEEKSNWAYAFKIRNTTTGLKRIAILTAGILTTRIVQVNSGNYKAIGGADVAYTGTEPFLILYDRPNLVNLWTQITADCVATTTLDGRQQIIFADTTGNVLFENLTYNGGVDFFRNLVLHIPVRIFQIQINSNNIDQFSQKIVVKSTNPFRAPKTTDIAIEDWFAPLQNQNKVIIKRPVVVGPDTVLTIDVPAQAESTFTFKVSALLNQRLKLDKLTD